MMSRDHSTLIYHSFADGFARRLIWVCFVCLSVLALGAETNQVSTTSSFPKSVFVSEGGIGKDPFFPNSTRLTRSASDNQTKTNKTSEDFSKALNLTGIARGARTIATINGLTFAAGEEQEVKTDGRKVKIKVLEIREQSVVVQVENQAAPVELKLRDVQLKFTE